MPRARRPRAVRRVQATGSPSAARSRSRPRRSRPCAMIAVGRARSRASTRAGRSRRSHRSGRGERRSAPRRARVVVGEPRSIGWNPRHAQTAFGAAGRGASVWRSSRRRSRPRRRPRHRGSGDSEASPGIRERRIVQVTVAVDNHGASLRSRTIRPILRVGDTVVPQEQVVADAVDRRQHLQEVRPVLPRPDRRAHVDPQAHGAARVIAVTPFTPKADELGRRRSRSSPSRSARAARLARSSMSCSSRRDAAAVRPRVWTRARACGRCTCQQIGLENTLPTSTLRRVASPSPSNGASRAPPDQRMVHDRTAGDAIFVPRRSSRNESRGRGRTARRPGSSARGSPRCPDRTRPAPRTVSSCGTQTPQRALRRGAPDRGRILEPGRVAGVVYQ